MLNAATASPLPIRVRKPRRAAPADVVRPTRAEVNLAALRHNAHELRRIAGQSSVFAVIKADAYGHGAPAVARTLERANVPGFAVALVEEAMELRAAGIKAPIMVMGGHYGNAFEEVVRGRFTPVIHTADQVEWLAKTLRYQEWGPFGIHIKVDTGMSRLGARPRELHSLLKTLARYPEVRLDGLMSHLACADSQDDEASIEQLNLFDNLTAEVHAAGFRPQIRHVGNSAALLGGVAPEMQLVRPGVALYGVKPRPNHNADLWPVMKVRSAVVALRELAPGEKAGYGWTWTAKRKTKLATFAMGYADGLPRALSNRGHVLIAGKRAPIVGTVSMDMTMVDVTDHPGVNLQDEVVIMGEQQGPLGQDCITVEEIAEHVGTIPWEILTNISRRVPRFYREPLVSQARARALTAATKFSSCAKLILSYNPPS